MLVNYGVFSLILMVCTQINMGPFFERFLILAGPEGLGKKTSKDGLKECHGLKIWMTSFDTWPYQL